MIFFTSCLNFQLYKKNNIKTIMINKLLNIEFNYQVDAKTLTTIKTKGIVKGVFYPKNEKELIDVYNFLIKNEIPFDIVGNGSNILFSEKCHDIILISTKKLKQTLKIKDNFVYCSSSVMLNTIFQKTYIKGLSGFEYLAGIPASTGGAIKMNAGAFGHCIFDFIEKIKIFKDGKTKYITKKQIDYKYRKSNLEDSLILSAKFKLDHDDKCNIYKKYISFLTLRKQKQPQGFSAGCIFKNPPNYSAGELIDKCGLKGIKQNDAQISEKHANIIVNNGNATFDDILTLINLCKIKVKEKFNIDLELEIKII